MCSSRAYVSSVRPVAIQITIGSIVLAGNKGCHYNLLL